MKIAILHDDFPPYHEGGSGVIALQLAKQYTQAGHSVLVITTVRDMQFAGREHFEGFDVARLYSDYHPRFRSFVSLYNLHVLHGVDEVLRAFSPDIVHVHNVHFYLSYQSIVVAKKYAQAVFMTAHDAMSFCQGKLPSAGGEFPIDIPRPGILRQSGWKQFRLLKWRYNPFYAPVVRYILRKNVTRVLAVSNALKQALQANAIQHVDVIRNGIDINEWSEPADVEGFKKSYGVGDKAMLFGGRLSEAKGAYQMLKALAQVRKTVPDAQLLIVGKKDSVAERMIKVAADSGSVDGLIFTGWISGEQLRQAYYASALVVVPSLYLDPFPTVNLEAFACKRPVVATCFGGSSEIVEDGMNGFVVNPFAVDLMAVKIIDLLCDLNKRESFGCAGYARVQREFLLAKQAAAYENIFELAVNKKTSL